MKKIIAGLVAGMLLLTPALAIDGVGLIKGKLKADEYRTAQLVAVSNDTDVTLERVEVECGFFFGEELVGAENAYLENIEPGTEAYEEVYMSGDEKADSTRCRVVSTE